MARFFVGLFVDRARFGPIALAEGRTLDLTEQRRQGSKLNDLATTIDCAGAGAGFPRGGAFVELRRRQQHDHSGPAVCPVQSGGLSRAAPDDHADAGTNQHQEANKNADADL